jgi:hypothetical protein
MNGIANNIIVGSNFRKACKMTKNKNVKNEKSNPKKSNKGLVHSRLIAFESRYEEAQRIAAEKKADRELGMKKKTAFDAEPNPFLQKALDQQQMIKERLEQGFIHPFTKEVAGRMRKPFIEHGLRSPNNPVLKLFVSMVPKGGKARASNDKALLSVQSSSKLLTLDYPYIELNKTFLGALRIDCDGVFRSPDHVLYELEQLVKSGKLPCLPHIVVGDLLDDGTFGRPHFIFMLPPGSAVWNSDDQRCRPQIIKLFKSVYCGLCNALLEIGADPAAPVTTMRMKNPLSPYWHTLTPNMNHMPTLSDYIDWVDTKIDQQKLVRKSAAIQSDMDIVPSNQLFNSLRDHAIKLLSDWHFQSDPRMSGSKVALADYLYLALEKIADASGEEDQGLAIVIGKVSDYLALNFDPKILEGERNRGQILHITENLKTTSEKQSAGANHTNGVRKQKCLDKLLKAYQEMSEGSEKITVQNLARKANVSRAATYRHYFQCQQICLLRCIDKKVENTIDL